MKTLKESILAAIVTIVFLTSCQKNAGPIGKSQNPLNRLDNLHGLAASVNISGTTYYVCNSGNDSNNGTSPSTSWKTIAKVNSQTYNPNDGILFNGGQTFIGNVVVSSSESASAGTYLYFGSYGTGQATINAAGGNGFWVYDESNVWIDNLIVTGGWNAGTQSGNTGTGIYYDNDLTGSKKLGYCKVIS